MPVYDVVEHASEGKTGSHTKLSLVEDGVPGEVNGIESSGSSD